MDLRRKFANFLHSFSVYGCIQKKGTARTPLCMMPQRGVSIYASLRGRSMDVCSCATLSSGPDMLKVL